MIKVPQSRTGVPFGNCFAACVASVLELRLDQLPDPQWPDDVPWPKDGIPETDHQRETTQAWRAGWNTWANSMGLAIINLPVPGGLQIAGTYVIGRVTTAGGAPHSVVCLDGVIVWDPNPAQNSYHQEVESVLAFVVADIARFRERFTSMPFVRAQVKA